MMAPRLVELRRVLKPTGSIYLHCDPSASHYLKMLMDAVFGPENFRNEIIWQRFTFHADAKRWGRLHDTIIYYAKSGSFAFTTQRRPYEDDYVKSHFKADKSGRLHTLDNPVGQGSGPSRLFFGKEIAPPKGTHWRYAQERIDAMCREGRIVLTGTGRPRMKRFLDEMLGHTVGDVWTDITPINSQAAERLGYPTQKPEALLERIIKANSNEGDLVLDPFCGCGTTIAVAERLKRRWIGIDITHLAIGLIKHRLRDAFGDGIAQTYQTIGEPTSLPDAATLAAEEPFQFQAWALGLVGARVASSANKGADKGIDGRLYFHDEAEGGKTKQVVLSVKAGATNVAQLRDLRGVVDREQAEIGVLITMEEPTKPMRTEAAGAGFYDSPWTRKRHPRLQLLTVAELLEGKGIDMPPIRQVSATFKKAPRAKGERSETPPLPHGQEDRQGDNDAAAPDEES